MANDESPTATARATMNSNPTSRWWAPRAAAMSVLTELNNRGRPMTTMIPMATTLKTSDDGQRRVGDGEDRSEQDLLGGPRRGVGGGVEIEEERGEPDGGTEHDARGQVPAPDPPHADGVHHPGTEHAEADETRAGG